MKNRNTKPLPKNRGVIDRWTAAARGALETKQARRGHPQGGCEVLIEMEKCWSRIPNGLLEDEAGQLWLAFMDHGSIDDDDGYELVDVEAALSWTQHVSEFSDGYSGDVADICRIALKEIARLRQITRKAV